MSGAWGSPSLGWVPMDQTPSADTWGTPQGCINPALAPTQSVVLLAGELWGARGVHAVTHFSDGPWPIGVSKVASSSNRQGLGVTAPPLLSSLPEALRGLNEMKQTLLTPGKCLFGGLLCGCSGVVQP